MKTLVVGSDATGKSTIVRTIREAYGCAPIESSRSIEALAFRASHLKTPIDRTFLDIREQFYLLLEAVDQPKTLKIKGDIVTTNSTLTTRLSHAVMRTCIGEPAADDDTLIAQWQNDEQRFGTPLPDNIILTRAEPDIIRQRIIARQQAGARDEDFWGFNAPFYLERYQSRWEGILPALGNLGIHCTTIDTSYRRPDEPLVLPQLRHQNVQRPDWS